MRELVRGQKAKLSDLTATTNLTVGVDVVASGSLVFDISCFGVDANGKLSNDRYFIFYNQKTSPCGALSVGGAAGGDKETFQVNLGRLPQQIRKLVFTITIDGAGIMSQVTRGHLRLLQQGAEVARFPFTGRDFKDEKAVIVGEIYLKDVWRFAAVGQGFNGGLSALLKHFGGQESAAPAPAPPRTVPAPPKVAPPPPTPPPAPPKVSLSKVTLQKSGDKVSLEKRPEARGFGRVRVNLNWNRQPAGGGGFFSSLFGPKQIDLDVGCMFEMWNGAKGVVQALGNTWGNYQQPPYIHLEGDDRTGASTQGENLFINGDHFDQLKRILVFAFIYEGVPNWAATDGVVTIEAPQQPPIEVRLDRSDNKGMCAVALIENIRGQFSVTKLVEYFHGHSDLDQRFGFGFRWKAGSK